MGYFFLFVLMISIVVLLPMSIKLLPDYLKFRNSKYQNESGNNFIQTVFNKGYYGEFLTFSCLESLELYHKILANVYIKKDDGSTTEVDLMMISEKGIFVFESKNYGGWIFGDEKQKMWVQTFPKGTKNKFFNPIWQNKYHIKAVQEVLKLPGENLIHSYIVFSERCTLKKIQIHSANVHILKRDMLKKTLTEHLAVLPISLNREEINRFYIALLPGTIVDEDVKSAHIKSISQKVL